MEKPIRIGPSRFRTIFPRCSTEEDSTFETTRPFDDNYFRSITIIFFQETTYWQLSQDYWWPGMPTYVRQYVRGCPACQQTKIDRRPWKGPLQAIPGTKDARPFS